MTKQSWERTVQIVSLTLSRMPPKFKLEVSVLCWWWSLSWLPLGVQPRQLQGCCSSLPRMEVGPTVWGTASLKGKFWICHLRSKHWHQINSLVFSLKCCRQHFMGTERVKLSFSVTSTKGGKSSLSGDTLMPYQAAVFWGGGDQAWKSWKDN